LNLHIARLGAGILICCIAQFIVNGRSVYADSANAGVVALNAKPGGLTYGDWTVKFWQWLLSINKDKNPITDQTGRYCGEGQNSSSAVFFLSFSTSGGAVRSCNIPMGKFIMIPVNVVECSFAEFKVKTEGELHTCAREDESSNPIAFLSVDGKQITKLLDYRIHSRAFDINLPKDSVIDVSGHTRAVSDGYWILLQPLKLGMHNIHFKASLTNPTTNILTYSDDLNYNVNIVKPK
jgi:hypothetical protein